MFIRKLDILRLVIKMLCFFFRVLVLKNILKMKMLRFFNKELNLMIYRNVDNMLFFIKLLYDENLLGWGKYFWIDEGVK